MFSRYFFQKGLIFLCPPMSQTLSFMPCEATLFMLKPWSETQSWSHCTAHHCLQFNTVPARSTWKASQTVMKQFINRQCTGAQVCVCVCVCVCVKLITVWSLCIVTLLRISRSATGSLGVYKEMVSVLIHCCFS